MTAARENFLRHLAQTSDSPIGLEIEHAQGCWLYARGGARYLDLISGIGVANLGHGDPAVLAAIAEQSQRHLHVMVYGEYVLHSQTALAERLAGLLPAKLGRIYFTNSGAEAIEGAIKCARKFTRRAGFIAFDGAYHGDTMGALALAGNPAFRAPFEPLPGPVRHLPYGEVQALQLIDQSVAAVIIEPVQAEGGVRIPSHEFFHALRKRCDETGALLIFDEVLTAFGRIGRLFGFEHFAVVPDLLVLAKALGGGMPLGAFCGADALLGCLAHDPPLGHITTFGGHPVCCAAGLAALDEMVGASLWERARDLGEKFLRQLLKRRDGKIVVGVRGIGMLFGLDFCSAAAAQSFVAAALAHGVVINWTLNAETVVRIAPPLVISEQELDFALSVIDEALATLG